jgi:hypothetical protein
VPPDSESVSHRRLAWNRELIDALGVMQERYGSEIAVLEAIMGMDAPPAR